MEEPGRETPNPTTDSGPKRPKRNIAIIVIIVAVAVIVALYFANRNVKSVVAQQEQRSGGTYPEAPGFELTDIFGHSVSLSEYRGKVVLLDFWATWCGPCRMEIPGFVQLQNKYGPDGFQAIGISMDDGPQPVLDFYKQFNMNYRVAMDNGKVSQLYGGIIGLPTTFLIGRDGRIYDKVPGAVDVQRFELEVRQLLAQPAGGEASNFKPAGASASINVETPAEANSPVPGIDVTKLSKAQIAEFKTQLTKEKCNCGCNYNLLQCRTNDPSCEISRDLARQKLAELRKPAPKG
ncbi:MAG: TlpA family protein disulfide reductase [Terriglobia bacterium]